MKKLLKFNLVRDLIAIGILLAFIANAIGSTYLETVGVLFFLAGVAIWILRKFISKRNKQDATHSENQAQ